jgi:hypothetical protein
MSVPIGSVVIPGWTSINGELAWGGNANPFGPKTPSGAMFVDLSGYHDSPPYGGIAQTIQTVPGQQYEVSVMLGADQDNGAFAAPVAAKVIAGTLTNEFTLNVPPPPKGNQWQTFTIPYTATGSSTLVSLQGATSAGGQLIALDNASFKTAAGLELLQNGSFENTSGTFAPDPSGGQSLAPGATVIPGWTVSGGELVWLAKTNHFGGAPAAGNYFLDLTGYHDSVPYGGVNQLVATTPGQQYQLTFSLGTDEDVGSYRGPASVTATIGGAQPGAYTFTPPGTGNQWQTFSFDFQAASASTEIQVIGSKAAGGGYLGLDNIRVTAVTRILNVTAAGGVLSFHVVQANYTIETTTDPARGPWQAVTLTGTPHADGTTTLSVPLNPAEHARFFRLRTP